MLARLLSARSYKKCDADADADADTTRTAGASASASDIADSAKRVGAAPTAERNAREGSSSLRRVPSENIDIPLRKCASEHLQPRACHVPRRRLDSDQAGDGEEESAASSAWRKQQWQCANCAQISYRSASDTDLGVFCSLDCKSSHEYMKSMHVSVDAQLSSLVDTWVDDDGLPSSTSSSAESASVRSGRGASAHRL